jgi:hypothetical protein
MDATIVAAEQEAIRDLQVELVIQLIWGRKGKETDEVKGNREEMNKRIKSLGDLSSDIVLSAAPSTGHFQVTKRPASDMVPDGLPYFTDDLVP